MDKETKDILYQVLQNQHAIMLYLSAKAEGMTRPLLGMLITDFKNRVEETGDMIMELALVENLNEKT